MKLYFTFGSAKQYPYHDDEYVLVIGTDMGDCIKAFQSKYPDVTEGLVNCAFYYTEKSWKEIEPEYYAGIKPVETLISEKAITAYDEVMDNSISLMTVKDAEKIRNKILSMAMNICDNRNRGDISELIGELIMKGED